MLHHINTTEYLNFEGGSCVGRWGPVVAFSVFLRHVLSAGKFSKSRGVGVFGDDAKSTNVPRNPNRYCALCWICALKSLDWLRSADFVGRRQIASEVWRYYLLVNRPEQSDTMFTWEDFAAKNNNELLANLGPYAQHPHGTHTAPTRHPHGTRSKRR